MTIESKIADRNRKLSRAGERYIRGEIDLKRYEKLERENMVDYRSMVRALRKANQSQRSVSQQLKRQLGRIQRNTRLMKAARHKT